MKCMNTPEGQSTQYPYHGALTVSPGVVELLTGVSILDYTVLVNQTACQLECSCEMLLLEFCSS